MNFATDIPLSLAIAAHSGTSFVPEKRGASEVSGYSAELEDVYNTLKSHAQRGGTLDLLEDEKHTEFYVGDALAVVIPLLRESIAGLDRIEVQDA